MAGAGEGYDSSRRFLKTKQEPHPTPTYRGEEGRGTMRAGVPPSQSSTHIEESSRDDSGRGGGDSDDDHDSHTAEGR